MKKWWQIWKEKPKERPNKPVYYPSGTCLETEKCHYYIKGKLKIRIPSERVLNSWKFSRIVFSSEAAVSGYKTASTKLGFREGTLLKNIADGKLYLISENKTRHITNPNHIVNLDLKSHFEVAQSEIDIHEKGDALD